MKKTMKKIISKIIVVIAILASTTLLSSCKEVFGALDNVTNVDMFVEGKGVFDHAAKVEMGTTLQLKCSGLVYEDSKISWKSEDESIATVDENGLVTPVAIGKVKIMASTKSEYVYQSGYVTVTVVGTSVTLGDPIDQALAD